MSINFLFLLIFICVVDCKVLRPTVNTTSGILEGKFVTILGKRLGVFLGIPYAQPPIRDLRFKAPLPYINENSVLDSSHFAPICYQPPHDERLLSPLLTPNQRNMSEDCLYINVYVPRKHGKDKFPVMVWLPGEGFGYADPTQFDGSFLAVTQKLIVVTVSYRLSVFGFFNGLSEDAPGNVGLWDQRLALKWVTENIQAFGGDPNRVTLSGRFSGAMSTIIHAFSPLAAHEKLFQRIIVHSGVPDGKWVFNDNPLNSAMELAQAMDCVFSNFSMTISCLKRFPAEVLLNKSNSMLANWRPSLDFNLISESTLAHLLKGRSSNVDALIGTNSNEGSLCLSYMKVLNPTLYELIIDNKLSKTDFEELVTFSILDVFRESNQLVRNLALFNYAAHNESSRKDKYVEFCGDLYINALSGKLADLLSEGRKGVYVYELHHRPSFSIQPSFINAGHGNDVLYALGLPLQIENLPEEEILLTKRVLEAISNFVYHGNPNAEGEEFWPPYTRDTKLVRRFGNIPETQKIAQSSHINAVRFWQNIIPNIFSLGCSGEPLTAALTDYKENEIGSTAHSHFLGTWISIPAAEYIIVGLLCFSSLLFAAVVIALVVILRHTPTIFFRRL